MRQGSVHCITLIAESSRPIATAPVFQLLRWRRPVISTMIGAIINAISTQSNSASFDERCLGLTFGARFAIARSILAGNGPGVSPPAPGPPTLSWGLGGWTGVSHG